MKAPVTETAMGDVSVKAVEGGVAWSYTAASTAGGKIFVNSQYFSSPSTANIKLPNGNAVSILDLESSAYGRTLDTETYQGMMFLHEFSHMIGRRPDDRNNPAERERFNREVLSKCL